MTMFKLQNYINGELVDPNSNQHIENYDPSRGIVYSLIPDSDERDAEKAIAAAKEAFKTLSVTPKETRSKYLLKIASLIEEQLDELAKAEELMKFYKLEL